MLSVSVLFRFSRRLVYTNFSWLSANAEQRYFTGGEYSTVSIRYASFQSSHLYTVTLFLSTGFCARNRTMHAEYSVKCGWEVSMRLYEASLFSIHIFNSVNDLRFCVTVNKCLFTFWFLNISHTTWLGDFASSLMRFNSVNWWIYEFYELYYFGSYVFE